MHPAHLRILRARERVVCYDRAMSEFGLEVGQDVEPQPGWKTARDMRSVDPMDEETEVDTGERS